MSWPPVRDFPGDPDSNAGVPQLDPGPGTPPATTTGPAAPPVGCAAYGISAMPYLRKAVSIRIIEANEKHAEMLWKRRGRDPINEHALLFFYGYAIGELAQVRVWTATRLLPPGDEPLLRVLDEMTAAVSKHRAAGNSAEQAIFSSHEPRPAEAVYLGTGVSTVGTPQQPWSQLQRDAMTDVQLPGRCTVMLDDRSCVLVDRHAGRQWGEATVRASSQLYGPAGRHRLTIRLDRQMGQRDDPRAPRFSARQHLDRFERGTAIPDDPESGSPAVWQQLAALHQVMRQVTA
jgi:hypothetical protein